MRLLLVRVVVLALAFLLVDLIMDTVSVSGGFLSAIGLAVLYGLVSAVVGTALRFLALPLIAITAGLFELVINAGLLLVTDWLTDWIEIDGFLSALGAAVVLSLTSMLIGTVMAVALPETRAS
jgi:putative membrane protein